MQRLRTWCVSADPEFAPKAAEIVALHMNPPANAVVISVDEKPSIQAIERPSGYVETDSGAIVRALKSTYKRNNIEAQVRNALQSIQTARQRITAAEASERAAKEKLESESRLFQTGESTNSAAPSWPTWSSIRPEVGTAPSEC